MIPFIVVTVIIMSIFSYLYFVMDNSLVVDDEMPYASMNRSFFTIYESFLRGPDEMTGLLDILFGFIFIAVLLNVLIAIVCEAWVNSARGAKKAFWKHRLSSLQDIALLESKCNINNNSSSIDDNKTGDTEYSTSDLENEMNFLDSWTLGKVQEHFKWNNYSMIPKVKLLSCTLLGFCSFGLCWPMFFREVLFTTKSKRGDDVSRITSTRINDLVNETMIQKKQLIKMEEKITELTKENKEQRKLSKDSQLQIQELLQESRGVKNQLDFIVTILSKKEE